MARLGVRDQKADPVVSVTTYGRPGGDVIRVVDTIERCGAAVLIRRATVERARQPIPETALELFERRWAEREAREQAP